MENNKQFDMEEEVKRAIDKWDNEHNNKDTEECPNCGVNKDDLLGQMLSATIVENIDKLESGSMGIIVDLPNRVEVAELMLVSIVNTMALSSNQDPLDVLAKLAENMSKDLMRSPAIRKR